MAKQLIKRIIMTLLVVIMSLGITIAKNVNEATLIVTSDGPTKDAAVKNALRLAVEQTYGAFVSSNTDILNDEIVRDNIATISSGNIKNYREISVINLSNGNVSVTLEATLSIGKIVQYAKSRGVECDFDGKNLAANIALENLYRNNEITAVENLIKETAIGLREGFDYTIELENLKFNETERMWDSNRSADIPEGPFKIEVGSNVEIPFKITVRLNSQGEQVLNNLLKSLKVLGKGVDSNENTLSISPGYFISGFNDILGTNYNFRSSKSRYMVHYFLTRFINDDIISKFVIKLGDSIEVSDEEEYRWGSYFRIQDPKFFAIYYDSLNGGKYECPKFKAGTEFFFFVGKLRISEKSINSINKIKIIPAPLREFKIAWRH